jgi:hypothetical protein
MDGREQSNVVMLHSKCLSGVARRDRLRIVDMPYNQRFSRLEPSLKPFLLHILRVFSQRFDKPHLVRLSVLRGNLESPL